jgi:hypothetical protein
MIYAINKRTKEHRVIGKRPPLGHYPDEGWVWVEADADGWIEWHGGECPLPDGAPYETKHESGAMFEGGNPETFMSHWRGYNDAVIAYRPILDSEPAEPEAAEWDGESWPPPLGAKCEFNVSNDDEEDWQHVVVAGQWQDWVVFCQPDVKWAICADGGPRMFRNNDPDNFRPIRTPAQRAEDEAVEEMLSIMEHAIEDATDDPAPSEMLIYAARALHRAGYRKT